MKLTKRILAMALALMMVLSLSVSAFASEGHNNTITIKNSNAGYTYTAYQIFSGNLGSDGVLSNIEWGNGVNGAALLTELQGISTYASCTNAKEVAAKLAGNSAMDDPDAIAFAEIVKKHLATSAGTSAWDSVAKQYVISGLEDGYYFVENTGIPSGANTTYSRYILEVVRDVTVSHKGDFPKVEKHIIEADLKLKANQASIGEDELYEITGTLPSNIAEYDTYYYAFHDSLSKGLTYKPETLKVTVNGVDVTQYFYAENSVYNESTGTNIYVGIQDLLALELIVDVDPVTDGNQTVGDITANTKVVVTYAATVNENAVIAGEGNPNEVYLEYSNDPNNDGDGATTPPPPGPGEPTPSTPTGKTPEDQVKTFVTELTIQKKDGAGNILTGAEFTLTGDAVIINVVTRGVYEEVTDGTGTHWLLKDGSYTTEAPVFVDDPATTSVDERNFEHYAAGRYTESDCDADFKLVTKTETIEKVNPTDVKGYVNAEGKLTFTGLGAGTYTLTETKTPDGYNTIAPIVFTVSFDYNTHKFSSNNPMIWVETNNTLQGEIINTAGTVLPSTGGMGTTLFYIFGGLMFVGAAVLLVTKKRMAM